MLSPPFFPFHTALKVSHNTQKRPPPAKTEAKIELWDKTVEDTISRIKGIKSKKLSQSQEPFDTVTLI